MNEYKEEKYFYTRLVNWLDKNEKGRVNPHHESGCPAIFKELTTKAQNEWKELADKLPETPKSEDYMRADEPITYGHLLRMDKTGVEDINYINQLRYERLMAKAMYYYEYQDWFDQDMKKHNQCFRIAEAYEARAKKIKERM